MSTEAALHISRNGATLAVCDGPELLVYGGDGSPRWKHFCDGILVGVRVTDAQVIVVDADGRLTRFRAADGQLLDAVALESGGVQDLDATSDSIALARTDSELLLVEGISSMGLNQGAASAARFGASRTQLGVGWANGTFRAFDLAGGEMGEQQLGAPVDAVAWSPRGAWIVAAGPQLSVISADGKEIQKVLALGSPTTALDADQTGVFAAGMVGHNQVFVADLHHGKLCGTLDFKRELGGVFWGGVGQLAVGLDDGDATLIDVFTGRSVRTEPHPGRGRNTWSYDDHLAHDDIRGAAAFSQAGGTPIARYEGYKAEGWKWWQIALMVMAVSTVICMGCTGCAGITWYLRSIGLF